MVNADSAVFAGFVAALSSKSGAFKTPTPDSLYNTSLHPIVVLVSFPPFISLRVDCLAVHMSSRVLSPENGQPSAENDYADSALEDLMYHISYNADTGALIPRKQLFALRCSFVYDRL